MFAKNQTERNYEISQACGAGFWVVIVNFPCYCRATDAYVGQGSELFKTCDFQFQAEEIANGLNNDQEDSDYCYSVEGPEK